MIFVDSSVLIDVLDGDGPHGKWSTKQFLTAEALVINHIVVAEVAGRFHDAEALTAAIRTLAIGVLPLDDLVSFRAGQAFRMYREQGGPRETILADFFIGAHAELLGAQLLTRDARRFKGYFPILSLIAPEKSND